MIDKTSVQCHPANISPAPVGLTVVHQKKFLDEDEDLMHIQISTIIEISVTFPKAKTNRLLFSRLFSSTTRASRNKKSYVN